MTEREKISKEWLSITGVFKRAGKLGGPKTKELGIGIHGLSEEERKENASEGGKLGGKRTQELGIGIHGLSEEERIQNASEGGKLGGLKTKELGVGIHGISEEERIQNASNAGKLGGLKTKELGVGLFGLSEEERIQNAIKANKSRKTIGTPPKHPINVYDSETNEFIKEYPSISECARDMKLHKTNISFVCKGKFKQYKGYTFEYKK